MGIKNTDKIIIDVIKNENKEIYRSVTWYKTMIPRKSFILYIFVVYTFLYKTSG